MANSTTPIQQIIAGANADVRVNENFDAASPAMAFGRRAAATTGLTWAYYGGSISINGVPTDIANGTVTLTASTTNYVGLTQAGVVAVASTANPLHIPLYTVVTGASTVTSYTDTRNASDLSRHAHGQTSITVTTANVTLTQAQALCDTITITGALTAARDVIVPLVRRRWVVRHTGTDFAIQVIGATGTGVTVEIGGIAIVECDGTNIISVVNPEPVVQQKVIPIACSDEDTALTTGVAKITFRMPYAMTLTAVRASLTTAQTSGASLLTVDINENGSSILSTKLTIDNTEKTSTTAATAAVISDTALADDAEITVDIDLIGDGTAKGLKVYLIGV